MSPARAFARARDQSPFSPRESRRGLLPPLPPRSVAPCAKVSTPLLPARPSSPPDPPLPPDGERSPLTRQDHHHRRRQRAPGASIRATPRVAAAPTAEAAVAAAVEASGAPRGVGLTRPPMLVSATCPGVSGPSVAQTRARIPGFVPVHRNRLRLPRPRRSGTLRPRQVERSRSRGLRNSGRRPCICLPSNRGPRGLEPRRSAGRMRRSGCEIRLRRGPCTGDLRKERGSQGSSRS